MNKATIALMLKPSLRRLLVFVTPILVTILLSAAYAVQGCAGASAECPT
ncbi:MAG: hypothetical protein ACXAD7_04000 [Candidatus Kariarchaeaceae archaeon]